MLRKPQNPKPTSPGFIIAIDGPAGSGKTTTARLCAQRLGFLHLDTGAMYRAVTLKLLKNGFLKDKRLGIKRRGLKQLLQHTSVDLTWEKGHVRIKLDGKDVTTEIRSPEVSSFVSEVSALPAVRRKLVAEQRRLAQGKNLVCEGRDIGSVVFPQADLKIFLDCDLKARATRRLAEMTAPTGLSQADSPSSPDGLRAVLSNLSKRDRIDSTRKMSPLRRVKDAILIDTTHLTIEEQVGIVCDLTYRRMAAAHHAG